MEESYPKVYLPSGVQGLICCGSLSGNSCVRQLAFLSVGIHDV